MEAEDVPNALLAKTSSKTTTSNKNSPSKGQKKNNGHNGKGQNKNKDPQQPSKIKGLIKQNASSHECHNKESKNKNKDKNKDQVQTNLQFVQAKVQESNLNLKNLKANRRLEAKKRAIEQLKNSWKEYQAKTKKKQSQKQKKSNKTLQFQPPKIPQQEKTQEPLQTGVRQRKLSHQQHQFQDQQGILNSERSQSSQEQQQVPPQPQPQPQPQLIYRQSPDNFGLRFYRSQISDEDSHALYYQMMFPQQKDIIFRGCITTNNRTEAIQVDDTQNHPPLVLRPSDELNNAQVFTIKYYGNDTVWIRSRDGLTLQVVYNPLTGNPPRLQLRQCKENEASKFKLKKHIFLSYNRDRIGCRKFIYYQDYFLAFDDSGPAREVRFYQHVPHDLTSQELPRRPVLWRFQKLNDQ